MTSTNDVEVAYGYYQAKFRGLSFGVAGKEFDHWLNKERVKVWDEAYTTGRDDEAHFARGLSTDPGADEVPHSNPYRKEDS